ncbi:MAG TPA: YdcF family protein [Ilumatobacteraceae bacterium]
MVALVVLFALGYFLVTFVQVWATGRRDQARPVDAIVVMGAAQYDGTPSPQLAARLDHAADLWQLGLAPIVVVTGGSQPGDRFTEAEASAAYLVERGVPSDVIVQEQDGRSSWESLANVADVLEGTGVERILLVSDPFHSLRIRLTAEELGFEAYTSPTRSSPVTGTSARSREAKEAAGIALGRIIGFERLWRLTG